MSNTITILLIETDRECNGMISSILHIGHVIEDKRTIAD